MPLRIVEIIGLLQEIFQKKFKIQAAYFYLNFIKFQNFKKPNNSGHFKKNAPTFFNKHFRKIRILT
jgi:hypothetical protein